MLVQVVLEVDVPEGVEVVSQTSHCTSGDTEGLSCDGLKIGDVVRFEMCTDRRAVYFRAEKSRTSPVCAKVLFAAGEKK